MLICNRFEDLANLGETLHLALGVFDGVHLGHQAVIREAVEAAARHGGIPGLVTFDPHPIRVIAPAKAPASLLATLDHKAQIVEELGVELFVPLHFDEDFAKIEASEFMDRLTAAPVHTIAVGEDWRFGHNRGGDVPFLRTEAIRRGFELRAIPPVMIEGDRISSTRIRQAIRDGNLEAAGRMLGRPYSVSGTVTRGRQLGRTLGFPTANLATGDTQLPPDGVWAVRIANPAGMRWDGVANLGSRPTVEGGGRLLEAHLFGYSGDLYDSVLEVTFEARLRHEAKFPSLDALRAQITLDAKAAREILRSSEKQE